MSKDQPGDTDVSWPALTFEQRPWQVRPGSDVSRTQLRKHQGPYEAAVVPEIAGVAVRLPTDVLAEAEDTALAISRFDEYVSQAIPGESELAPLSSVLLRSESASSSQIEHLTVGARQLALVEIGELSGRNAKIVASNVTAMQAALELSDRLDKDSILTMHEALLAGSDPDHAGQWRSEQVWIGGGYAAVGPHTASFVPPHDERVEPALDDLVEFIDREDVPITVQAAIAHAQFETIHPFTDGNGRTGRALIHAMLRGKGLTRRVTVPISAGLLIDTDSYFDALEAYRRGNLVPIVRRVNAASFAAIDNGKELVDDLADIRTQWGSQITARRDAAAWKLADLLLRQPVVNNAEVVRELAVSVPAAQTAIDHLAGIGALVASDNKTRNRVWQSPDVLGALDAFAARTGRRHAARTGRRHAAG